MLDTDDSADAAPEADGIPEALRLNAIEARVLGCLVEKEATTPEQYPLTENALTLACNQKTSREPIMELTTGEVGHALRQLESRHLVRSTHGSRAQRWEHRFAAAYELTVPQQAVLCVLMLRGPQTLNELFTRAERIGRLSDADQARHALERLGQRRPALVTLLPRAPGQREDRWAHLLSGAPDPSTFAAAPRRSESLARDDATLMARVEALETRLNALEALLATPGANSE